jgi:type I restriction enzyme M protein
VVPELIPDYLKMLKDAETRRADLDAQLKTVTATPDDEDDDSVEMLSPAELKQMKGNLINVKREVKRLEVEFLDQMKSAVARLDAKSQEALVRRILKADLEDRTKVQIDAVSRGLFDRYYAWADKYAVTLRDMETQCDEAVSRFNAYLQELGYE